MLFNVVCTAKLEICGIVMLVVQCCAVSFQGTWLIMSCDMCTLNEVIPHCLASQDTLPQHSSIDNIKCLWCSVVHCACF